ncbi:MAG: HAMP domain-containing protein [Deltaproteobacteria bacterium]|nr:HAMP domain-containing protein [Deltaproteobacteria bacterium]TLN01945.1 MAG: HAMP domain-containing protein [bacterium]
MRIKIQWKLMASYLALVILIGTILYGYLNHTLRNNLDAEIRENLFNETRLVRLMSTKELAELDRDAPALARTAGKEIKARVSIIRKDGKVAGDSELTDTELLKLENHASRPEFIQAIENDQGVATRFSATLGTNMIYTALPFQTTSGQPGVIRLALPLSRIDAAMSSLGTILGASLFLAVICSLLLSYLLSFITSRPLRSMAAAAARIGKGEFGSRIPVSSSDEIGELAEVLNEMAEKTESQLEKISAEKNRLDTILRGMGEGVIVTDDTGIVTLANPAFRALFSLDQSCIGKALIEIARQPSLNNALKKVLNSREELLEELVMLVPEEKNILTHWVPLLEESKLIGTVAVFHDITDLKMLEKIRKDFVANVSHELRTPVSVIKGYAETILSEGQNLPAEKLVQFIEVIHSHAERLAHLISDLLTLSRIESGAIPLEPVPVSILAAVNRVTHLLDQKALSKEVTLTKTAALSVLPDIQADPDKLEQILINLLDNAIKFTPAKGTVTIDATDLGDRVRIDVKDTGIGIPAKDIPRIFERFYRVDTARSRELGGTGLGLSIVKHIVQAHGGSVAVESTPGKGSIFSFTLRKA